MITHDRILAKSIVLSQIQSKTVRSNLWVKKGLCRCPACPRHHIYGTVHPIYRACIFCFSVYERSLFPNIWEDWYKYSKIPRCDFDVIEKLRLENLQVSYKEKKIVVLSEAVRRQHEKAQARRKQNGKNT